MTGRPSSPGSKCSTAMGNEATSTWCWSMGSASQTMLMTHTSSICAVMSKFLTYLCLHWLISKTKVRIFKRYFSRETRSTKSLWLISVWCARRASSKNKMLKPRQMRRRSSWHSQLICSMRCIFSSSTSRRWHSFRISWTRWALSRKI